MTTTFEIVKFVRDAGGSASYRELEKHFKLDEVNARRGVAEIKRKGYLHPVAMRVNERIGPQSRIGITPKGETWLAGQSPKQPVTRQGTNPFDWKTWSTEVMLDDLSK